MLRAPSKNLQQVKQVIRGIFMDQNAKFSNGYQCGYFSSKKQIDRKPNCAFYLWMIQLRHHSVAYKKKIFILHSAALTKKKYIYI
jgi:histidinol phosphatase-like enzyme